LSAKTNAELFEARQREIPQGVFNINPVFAASARGARITDVEGQSYLDFAGGIGVANVGHCDPGVVEAVQRQAERLLHSCFHVVMYEPYLELASRLNRLTPGGFAKKSFLVNSGAEAVDNAVKIARAATGRQGIVAFQNAFHGRTYMAMTLTGKVKPYKMGFQPFCPEVYRAPFAYCYRCPLGQSYPGCKVACAEALEDLFINGAAAETVAAVIAEPIQGEGGFIAPPPEFFPRVAEICRRHGILFVMDEIQTGMGRTGRLYASEHFGVEPDMILTGKSLAGGLPLAAVTGRAEVMDAPMVGGLGGTYGGNPLACQAALKVLEAMEGRLLERARGLGERLAARLAEMQERHRIIGEVRGLGPMMALELVADRESREPAAAQAKELVARCREQGLLILACGNYGNVIRTLMPLAISDQEAEEGLGILDRALDGLG
jgi:4-aminobutyrate aminotransferase/(S)-3-amino-2-methylpropionate transaminase